jgi:hypothetical protein
MSSGLIREQNTHGVLMHNGSMDVTEVKPFDLCIAFGYPAGFVCSNLANETIYLPGIYT